RAGAFVSIDAEGRLSVDRGYIRPEDELPVAESEGEEGSAVAGGHEAPDAVQKTVISVAGASTEPVEDGDDDPAKPLPDRLIAELSSYRTLALRDALAEHPAIAFLAVLHAAVLISFYRFASSGSCLEIALHTPTFTAPAPDLKESIPA